MPPIHGRLDVDQQRGAVHGARCPEQGGTVEGNIRKFVVTLLGAERDMTFATVRADGYPQANIVSYANDGLNVYFGTGRDSQKVRNLRFSSKASITVAAPYADWGDIRGVSMGGTAQVLADGSLEQRRAADLLAKKFPEVKDLPPVDAAAIAFVKFVPIAISVLDYRRGFGHTELVEVASSEI